MKTRTNLIWLALAIAIALGVTFMTRNSNRAAVDVRVPTLSAAATEGRELFNANCAACHGKHAAGTGNGPPLVHKIYEPGHHGDQAFFRAARFGVRAHHWQFGNMPPVSGVGQGEVAKIVSYIRELQRANGIF
ncbi:MAG TPA: c-type cytochrome [Rhizobiales bacterium]|nr:c-type cytochrome [Hyphomicrobiales bacterium]